MNLQTKASHEMVVMIGVAEVKKGEVAVVVVAAPAVLISKDPLGRRAKVALTWVHGNGGGLGDNDGAKNQS